MNDNWIWEPIQLIEKSGHILNEINWLFLLRSFSNATSFAPFTGIHSLPTQRWNGDKRFVQPFFYSRNNCNCTLRCISGSLSTLVLLNCHCHFEYISLPFRGKNKNKLTNNEKYVFSHKNFISKSSQNDHYASS